MKRSVLLVTLAVTALAGCSGYRYVRRTQTGGTIALQGDREGAMEKARSAMASHCQGAYTVVEEGEVVIGEDTYVRADNDPNRRGGTTTHAGATTTQKTEWRVTYVCGVNAPPPAPGTPPAYAPTPAPYGTAPTGGATYAVPGAAPGK